MYLLRLFVPSLICIAVLAQNKGTKSTSSQTSTTPNPSYKPSSYEAISERGKQLRRESQILQRDWARFEANVNERRQAFAEKALEKSTDVLKGAMDCGINPAACKKPPRLKDLLSLSKELGAWTASTGSDLLDLRDEYNGLVARQLKMDRDIKGVARERDSSKPPKNPPPKPPPPTTDPLPLIVIDHGPGSNSLDDYKDDITVWCFETKGDRCFDGRPKDFEAFLKRHPELARKHEAIRQAPDNAITEKKNPPVITIMVCPVELSYDEYPNNFFGSPVKCAIERRNLACSRKYLAEREEVGECANLGGEKYRNCMDIREKRLLKEAEECSYENCREPFMNCQERCPKSVYRPTREPDSVQLRLEDKEGIRVFTITQCEVQCILQYHACNGFGAVP
ncbi:MAG TPA: hypothetical protein VEX68_14690 [Bryobacteraceae bacterium]|nr:hypothetical protein [Bryobacteraceae bacterium]